MSTGPEEIPVAVIKLSPVDVERFLARLRERIKESKVSHLVKEEYVATTSELADLFMDLVASTTSDIIISPLVADQVVLVDALTMVSAIEKTILSPVLQEMENHLATGRMDDYSRALSNYIILKNLCYDAMVQVLKRRLSHVYVNMPPNIRPSLGNASIGYEKIE